MRIRIVNQNEKNVIYLVTDSTESLNVPRIGEHNLLLAGDHPSHLKVYSQEELASLLKENGLGKSIYFGEVPIEVFLSQDMKEDLVREAAEDSSWRVREWLRDCGTVLKTDVSEHDGMIDDWKLLEFIDDKAAVNTVSGWIVFLSSIPSSLVEASELRALAIDPLSSAQAGAIQVLEWLANTRLSRDEMLSTEFPDVGEVPTSLEPINLYGLDPIPEIPSSDRAETAAQLEETLRALEEYGYSLRSRANLTFSPFDSFTQTWIEVDAVLVDGIPVDCRIEQDGPRFIYHIEQEVPHQYTLTLRKEGFLDAVFEMKSQVTSEEQAELLDIGKVVMMTEHMSFHATLTWGPEPRDVDTHVYTFKDNAQYEHAAWYTLLSSETSKIKIDRDDVTGWGPENTDIRNLHDDLWTFITIHNYSRYVEGDACKDMNPDHLPDRSCILPARLPVRSSRSVGKLLKVVVDLYGHSIEIKPAKNETSDAWWWDVLAIHDNKIYILNRRARKERQKGHWWKPSKNEIQEIIHNAAASTKIYDIKQWIPEEPLP